MSSTKKTDEYHTFLVEIKDGLGEIELASGKLYYYAHMTDSLLTDAEKVYNRAMEKGISMGLETEEAQMKKSIEYGLWSDLEEERLSADKWQRETLNKKKESVNSDQIYKSIEMQVNALDEKIKDQMEKRDSLVSNTCEQFASRQRNDYIISNTIFKDREAKEKLSDDNLALAAHILLREKMAKLHDRDFLARLSFETSFFSLFQIFYRSPKDIFGKNGMELTIPQRSLLSVSNSLLNKIKNTDLPEEIMGDPVKILDYKKDERTGEQKKKDALETLKKRDKANK